MNRLCLRGWALLTGGRPEGVMAAACRGAGRVEAHLVVGVLPGDGRGHGRQQTAELDLALFTGMDQARNLINCPCMRGDLSAPSPGPQAVPPQSQQHPQKRPGLARPFP